MGDTKDKKVEKLVQDQGVKARDLKPEDKADLAQDVNE